MRRADLAFVVSPSAGAAAGGDGVGGGCGVVQGHVCFYFFGVGAGGRLPAGFFCVRVEVVGEVFGVGVADFPGGGEAGFLGCGGLEGGKKEGVSRCGFFLEEEEMDVWGLFFYHDGLRAWRGC